MNNLNEKHATIAASGTLLSSQLSEGQRKVPLRRTQSPRLQALLHHKYDIKFSISCQRICQSSSEVGSFGGDSSKSRARLLLSTCFKGDFSATVNMGAPFDCSASSDDRAHRSSNSSAIRTKKKVSIKS